MQKSWASARHDRDQYQYFRQILADETADRVLDVKRSWTQALELGCDQGICSSRLSKNVMSYMVQSDPCPYVTYKANTPDGFAFDKMALDEETPLPYKDNTFDLVLSNLNLHWVNDLDKATKEFLRVLRPDGALIGSIWGNDSLFELRQSIQLAEMERRGGVVPRVGPLTRGDSFSSVLHNAGFKLITADYREEVFEYPTIFELLNDLQLSGEQQCAHNFRPLHPDILMSAGAIYQATFGDDYGIPATFRAISFIAWKPKKSREIY